VEIDARTEWEVEQAGLVNIACARGLGLARCAACDVGARVDEDRLRGGEDAEVAELEAYRARGLLGPPPGPLVAVPEPLGPVDRAGLSQEFRCPECGGTGLRFGDRLARHACPGGALRAVAWRGYDGALVRMSWWRVS
jgi:hypothetical protein